ncbi:MAG: DUF4180 domain-containing protein [Clostridiales bacterium]|jgi:hypothetical protein|nr:DUF4180 domain-containing protein [Clostridiales bacterium]
MKVETITEKGSTIAVVTSEQAVITDERSALDLMMSVKYETGAEKIVLNKEALAEDFFILSTGLAGKILQKFVSYHLAFAVYGDFTRYTSKPLRDFIYESNNGRDVFFAATREEAVRRMTNSR